MIKILKLYKIYLFTLNLFLIQIQLVLCNKNTAPAFE